MIWHFTTCSAPSYFVVSSRSLISVSVYPETRIIHQIVRLKLWISVCTCLAQQAFFGKIYYFYSHLYHFGAIHTTQRHTICTSHISRLLILHVAVTIDIVLSLILFETEWNRCKSQSHSRRRSRFWCEHSDCGPISPNSTLMREILQDIRIRNCVIWIVSTQLDR